MTKPRLSAKFICNVVVPAWIMAFGLVLLNAPVMGAAKSISMLVVGLVLVPGLILFCRPAEVPALVADAAARV